MRRRPAAPSAPDERARGAEPCGRSASGDRRSGSALSGTPRELTSWLPRNVPSRNFPSRMRRRNGRRARCRPAAACGGGAPAAGTARTPGAGRSAWAGRPAARPSVSSINRREYPVHCKYSASVHCSGRARGSTGTASSGGRAAAVLPDVLLLSYPCPEFGRPPRVSEGVVRSVKARTRETPGAGTGVPPRGEATRPAGWPPGGRLVRRPPGAARSGG